MPVKKSNFLIPAIGAAVIVAGGVATYLYFKGAFGGALSPLASAKVVPDEALMATFISTDSKPWSQLQQFGTPEAQKLVEKGLQGFNQQTLAKSNIDYEKDLKPWVGSVMVAVLPSNTVRPAQATPQAAQEPNVLMVLGIKDKGSALNFANKLKAEKGVKSKESDYKGQKITETTGNGERNYSAVLNNHLVIAPEQKAVEQAIDTFKGEPSFASINGVDSALARGVDVKNPLAQMYIPDYADVVQQLIATNHNAAQLPPATLAQLQQVKSVVAGVGVDDAGLRMKAIAKLDPKAIKAEYKPSSGNMVAQFPAETIALVTGAGINRTWEAFVEQTKTNSQLQQGLDGARRQLKTANIDLDKDIFGWMDGEFAFAAIPSNQGLLAPLGFGAALVIDTSSHATAEATLGKLDAIAKTNFINVAPRNVGGKTVIEWQIPQQGALLGHGWLDEDTLFVALGGPIADAIATPLRQPLDNSETFKAVTGSLQKPNGGYFYLDMDKTMSITRNLAQAQNTYIPPEVSTILDSIRGVGMTNISPDKSTSQVEMLLALKPRTK
jgi:hypothetical protein